MRRRAHDVITMGPLSLFCVAVERRGSPKTIGRYGCVHPHARPEGPLSGLCVGGGLSEKRTPTGKTITREQQVVADITGKIRVKAPATSAVPGRERMTEWRQPGLAYGR
jgi:hypothetical protein